MKNDPGTCGVGIGATAQRAGSCKPGITGLASCTFDGATSTSLAAGSHVIQVVGTSDTGASPSCTSYVRVTNSERPQIACAEPVVRECEGPATPASTTASCTDNCGLCGVECESNELGVGYNLLGCNTIDAVGNRSHCFAEVQIVDTVAPSLEMATSPSVLWPPNHKMQPVSITTSTSDLCDPWAYVSCSASSNEAPLALGSGRTDPDIEWRWDGNEGGGFPQLYVRAERSGNGTGRVYTIESRPTINPATRRRRLQTVTVPHDNGH